MAKKIGVVSPELPSSRQLAINGIEGANIYWFHEIEALFAYLMQDLLDEIIVDEIISLDQNSSVTKYHRLIKQCRPQIVFSRARLLPSANGTNLREGQFFPKLEVLFKTGELLSVFQPIVRPQKEGNEIFGYECLSRIRYNNVNFAPEFLFNYAQEKLELSSYDKICLMQALEQAPHRDGRLIFINIRPQTLISVNFLPWFKELLKKHHLEPMQVVIEITEQYCAISDQEIEEQCRSLKRIGFRIAIDDFGSGLSNLSMLQIIEPDFIKISGRFIKGVHKDGVKQRIIKNALMLAEDFAILAVVENVECAEEWQLISKLGATLAQGFHFYRPMPSIELRALLY